MWKFLVPVAIVLAAIGGAIAWKVCHHTNASSAQHAERCPPVTTPVHRPRAAPARVSGHVTKNASGETAPAKAPCATMMAIGNAGIPARWASVMANGAMSAVPAILPAPIDDKTADSRKNITGTSPKFPRQPRTAKRATRSRVPFT